MSINFISSEDSDETRNIHTKSDNIEILMGSETNDIIKEFCESHLQKYQEGLEESVRGSEFVPDSTDLLWISLKRGESYVDSQKRLKNKKPTINQKNSDNNSFQYML